MSLWSKFSLPMAAKENSDMASGSEHAYHRGTMSKIQAKCMQETMHTSIRLLDVGAKFQANIGLLCDYVLD